ncbi:LacI family DNA-binding transcriptional regulator [Marinomonas gallaica]|uniref:LacI family DNA-binding transcriptional regulator n=1 Tax=Marinomonas gallaica TaxID=1806667 RepID=UPI003A8DB77E
MIQLLNFYRNVIVNFLKLSTVFSPQQYRILIMSTHKKKATITDVARKVGMTTITVSRALNTPEKVKQETLKKILAAAHELHYVPNAIARNLKSQESRIIGLVTASIDNPFYAHTFKAINRIAKSHNYSLMLFDTDGSEELEQKAIETLMGYQASGIILSAVSDADDYTPAYLHKLELTQIPVVQIDRKISCSSFPGVYLDNFNSGYKAMKSLLSKGFQNILVLAGPKESCITIDRINGIQKALEDCTLPISLTIKYGDYQKEKSKNAMLECIKSGQRPEAIFGLNILITIGAMEALQEAKLGIDQAHIMSIDDIPYSNAFGRPIPCVHHDTYELGASAVSMLLELIKNPAKKIDDGAIIGVLSDS